jgi:pantoate--beta-alanine ligase
VRTATTIAEARLWRREQAGTVGLVPTMGYLHPGHLSLLEAARRENDHVVASLFVNPTQFGPREDYAAYPRDLDRDRSLLEQAGCGLLFAPSAAEMYPPGPETTVDAGSVAARLVGARRPGHFRGVARVVLKLLQITTPDRAYFGEKDAQQLAVVRRLVADLDVPVEVCGRPTVRESDGLAMSSRNSYLKPEERSAAAVLYRALEAAEALWRSNERRGEALRRAMEATLASEPLARVDYAAVVDPSSFRELEVAEGAARLCLAVFFGNTRLIDNRLLEAPAVGARLTPISF